METTHDSASVVDRPDKNTICIALFSDFKPASRFFNAQSRDLAILVVTDDTWTILRHPLRMHTG